MQVDAVGVDLPDFDGGVSDRRAAQVEHAAAEVRDLAHGRAEPVGEHDQVVVGVEREGDWIEGPFGLPRRGDQRLREHTGIRERGRRTDGKAAQKSRRVQPGRAWGMGPSLSAGKRYDKLRPVLPRSPLRGFVLPSFSPGSETIGSLSGANLGRKHHT